MSGPVLVVVGAGPRGTGLLERIAANADLVPGEGCEIHVVDPHPPGAGRVWRPLQSPLLLMNSRAGEVTMFTDDSVRCAGPIRPGPTLAEWGPHYDGRDPGLAREAAALTPDSFASRRLAGAYLGWCFDRAVRSLPPRVRVTVHSAAAVALSDGDRQTLTLSTGRRLQADVVVLAQGNPGGHRTAEQEAHQAFATRTGGTYLPPACPGDEDLDRLPPGEAVLVSGLGLAFVDLAILLTEGRGGRFIRHRDGTLAYRPSGREPVLHAGSRRGVPYLPKPVLPELRDPEPRFFTAASAKHSSPRELVAAACRELLWAHYRELFAAHPERTRMDAAEFERAFARLPVTDPALVALVADAVPDPADRADLSFLRSPLAGLTFPGQAALGTWMHDRISRTVARATDPRHSAHAAVLHGLTAVGGVLENLLAEPETRAAATRVAARVAGFAPFLGSGPPPHRLEQLRALAKAGVLRFLGADLRITQDEVFVAHTSSLPHPVGARHLVEARLRDPDARSGVDPLLAGLSPARARVPVDPGTFQVLVEGRPHPRRLAMGLFVGGGALGSFSRPHRNAPFFRQNDATARWLLTELAGVASQTRTGTPVMAH